MYKKSFTMADRRSSRFHISNIQRKAVAFTMAEILLSLTIIGVVAAITLPSLTGNINERTWDTQRRAFYARMSQAIALMGSLNGYGFSSDSNQTISNAAKIFVTDGLSKVLKINNICDYQHFQDCGLASKITTIANSKINFPTTFYAVQTATAHKDAISSMGIYNKKAVAFETANGESVAVYYNPICQSDDNIGLSDDVNYYNQPGLEGNTIQHLCANFVFDMNGKKGPNTVGKDISTVGVFFPTDSWVANAQPNINYQGQATYDDAVNACKNLGEDYRLPTIQEWMTFYASNRLFDFESVATDRYWSITPSRNNPDRAWTMYSSYGIRRVFSKTLDGVFVRCVKK